MQSLQVTKKGFLSLVLHFDAQMSVGECTKLDTQENLRRVR